MKIGEINVTYCKLESDEKEMIEIPVQIEISPKYGGKRKIIVVDNNGYRVEKSIFFIEK